MKKCREDLDLSIVLPAFSCALNEGDHFLKMKYTASIRQQNAARWFHLSSILKAITEKTVKTTSVMTS